MNIFPQKIAARFSTFIASGVVVCAASFFPASVHGQFPAAPTNNDVDFGRPVSIKSLINNFRYDDYIKRSYDLLDGEIPTGADYINDHMIDDPKVADDLDLIDDPDVIDNPDVADPDPDIDPELIDDDVVVETELRDDDRDVELEVTPDADVETIDADSRTVDAQVVAVDEDRIEVRPRGLEDTIAVNVSEDVAVTLNRQPAKYDAIRKRDVVRITYSEKEPIVAERINIARANRPRLPVAFDTSDEDINTPEEDAVDATPDSNLKEQQAGEQDPRALIKAGLGVVVADSPGQGILVLAVRPGSPAANDGLQTGDYLLEVNGNKLQTPAVLLESLNELKPEDTVEIVLWRQGKTMRGTIKLASSGEAEDAVSSDGLGLVISDKFYNRKDLSTGRTETDEGPSRSTRSGRSKPRNPSDD